jgi:hypothetical protein
MLVVCMPVSFCVWYWDTPLQGWGSVSSINGWAVLVCNVVLCLSYFETYRSMLVRRATARGAKGLVLAGRILFGAWMVASGTNLLFGPFFPVPQGHQPLAVQLLTALADSRLLYVAAAIQLAAGTLILAGAFLPLALCVVMPISVCVAYWAVVLDHSPALSIAALAAVALNALLMSAYLEAYKPMLRRRALALWEEPQEGRNYDTLYAIPLCRISTAQFSIAFVVLLAVALFYYEWVPGRTGAFALLTLAYPAAVLVARLVQGMGRGGPATPVPV